MTCSHILEQSPRDWETTTRPNVVLTVFHTQNIRPHAWKLSEPHNDVSFFSNPGRRFEKQGKLWENLSHSFPCFSKFLPGIGEKPNINVWFLEFSTRGDIYFVRGKLSELHFDA